MSRDNDNIRDAVLVSAVAVESSSDEEGAPAVTAGLMPFDDAPTQSGV